MCIINTGCLWHTCSVEGCPNANSIKDRCDLRFIQLTCECLALLRPKPGTPQYLQGSVTAAGSVIGMLRKESAGEIKLPLRLHPQNLPVDTKDELLDETVMPILPLPAPYVTLGGHEIITDTSQSEKVPNLVELLDEMENDLDLENEDHIDVPPPEHQIDTPKCETTPTKLCSLILRKLSDKDIALWKPNPKRNPTATLPDETDLSDSHESPDRDSAAVPDNSTITPSGPRIVAGYDLRNKPTPVSWGKSGPSLTSKSKVNFDGLFSSGESSQDSKQCNDMDAHPGELVKLVKITGLSEPSPIELLHSDLLQHKNMGFCPHHQTNDCLVSR